MHTSIYYANYKDFAMKTLIYKGKTIKIYDSIDEMPIVNFQKYNKYLLIDSGIGSDVDDIDAHIVKIAKAIKEGNNGKAIQELQNMRQNINMINSTISPKYMAFAALIYSIDGEELTDLSDDNLKLVLESINKVKHSNIIRLLAEIKKKVSYELEMYFPGEFSNAKEKGAYDKIKNRTLLILESIISDIDNSEAINTIDASLFSTYIPKVFYGSESVEIKYDKQFENACLLISQKMNCNAKKMTVMQFYNALDNIKLQAEAEMKRVKRLKRR